jgi:exopolysaccharide biosynthesis polyprenyl glycosylphosphotransferase
MRAERRERRLTTPSAVRVPGRAPKWIVPAIRSGLIVSDALCAALSFVLAYSYRHGAKVFESGLSWTEEFAPYGALLLLVVCIRLLTLRHYDLYRLRGEFSIVDDSIKVFKATAIGSLLIVAAAFLYRGGYTFRAFSYARGVFLVDFVLALVSITAVRFVVRTGQVFVRKQQVNLIPTLVVGRGAEASLCINEMRDRPELGYRVIGVIDSHVVQGRSEYYEGVPVIGTLEGLPDAIRESGANEVIIADPQVNGDALFEVMMRCGRRRGIEFRIAPSLFNCLPRKTEIDQIGALPMIRLFREPLSNGTRLIKRSFDLLISAATIGLLFPIWLLIAVLIKLDSKGPIFYTQERVGMDGRLFLLYKFRTMQAGADPEVHREYQRAFIAGRAEANLGDVNHPTYKLFADPRITRIGRTLRRTSLDEVPQLLNVLMGDMSLVGPRPPIPYEVEAYELWHRKRLDMKPGLTGLWQVSGRNRLPFEEMVRLDLFYIENWSLLLDLKIILRTGFVMLGGEGF